MSYILNLETATKNCSVAVAKDGIVIALKEKAGEGYSHAELLHVFIEEAMSDAGITLNDLSAIAISQGPGSYTGLRIGVSAAKGLCFALDIPLIAIDTLETLALQVQTDKGWIVPMIDARRMEVYSAVFNSKLEKIRAVEAEIIDEHSFSDTSETIYIVGDCQEKIKTVLTSGNFVYLEKILYPSANEMAVLSYTKLQDNATVDVAYFEPYYLKDFMVGRSGK